MQRGFVTVALMALVFTFAAQAQSLKYYGNAPTDPLTVALLEKEQALMGAVLHRDAAAFSSMLTDDFVFVNYDGHSASRGELIGEGEFQEYAIYEPQTLTLNDGAVLFSYNAIVRQAASDDEQHIPRYQRVTTVWVKQGTDWKEKFHQTSALQVGS
jgi:ketosteroid isomerase-like protein